MIDHIEARTYASALRDGELGDESAALLDEHLASCASCGAFRDGISTLSTAVATLPRERAPRTLPETVLRRIADAPAKTARRRRAIRWIPAIAAAAALAVFATVVLPATRFPLPGAGAAEALAQIHSMVMKRVVTTFDEAGATKSVTRETIWFRAPASTRVEREMQTFGSSRASTAHEIEITVPGRHYVHTDATEYTETDTPPSTTSLPEPLSPALAYYGRRTGPGPEVAGRSTLRIELETPDRRRVAYVDAQRFTVVGAEESVVLGKEAFPPGRGYRPVTRKQATSVRYNVPIESWRFDISPTARVVPYGFRTERRIAHPPKALPRGFRVVRAGTGADGDAMLLARGAFTILVQVRQRAFAARPDELEILSRVGSEIAYVAVGFYELPRILFRSGRYYVSVSAALPQGPLAHLASEMYG